MRHGNSNSGGYGDGQLGRYGDGQSGVLAEPLLSLPEMPRNAPQSRLTGRLVVFGAWSALVLGFAAVAVLLLVAAWPGVSTTGALEPVAVHSVRSTETGLIMQIHVSSGDTVRAGQLIASLDTLEMVTTRAVLESERRRLAERLQKVTQEARVEGARSRILAGKSEAALIRARARMREARVQYGFQGRIPEPGSHSGFDYALADIAEAEADLALNKLDQENTVQADMEEQILREQVAGLNARLKAMGERLRRMQLYAPAAGVVLTEKIHHRLLELLERGESLLEIGSVARWQVEVMLGPQLVHRVRQGQRATVEIDGVGAKQHVTVPGRVTYLAAETSREAPEAGYYRALISVEPGQLAQHEWTAHLRRGYRVRVVIHTDHAGMWNPFAR